MIAILTGRVGLCPPLPCNDQHTGTPQPSPELFNPTLTHQMAARRVDVTRLRCVCTSPGSLLVAVLLLRAGVETNPGPRNQPRRLHSSLVLSTYFRLSTKLATFTTLSTSSGWTCWHCARPKPTKTIRRMASLHSMCTATWQLLTLPVAAWRSSTTTHSTFVQLNCHRC